LSEVWLRVSFVDTVLNRAFRLTRDGQPILSATILQRDTTVLDSSVTPNRLYTYKAYRLASGSIVDSSDTVHAKTLDTTSHNFTWRVDTLGETGNSFFADVAIIGDSVWAVGAVYVLENGQRTDAYNLWKWGGQQWIRSRVFFPNCDSAGNEVSTIPFPAFNVFSFGTNDTWLTSAGTFARWNGNSFQRTCLVFGVVRSLEKLWGTSSSNLYAVGGTGSILHYNGVQWHSIFSGTDIRLTDIFGTADGRYVWACGYQGDLSRSVLLEYDGSTWRTVRQVFPNTPDRSDSLSGMMTSVWSASGKEVDVATGNGMYRMKPNSNGAARRTWLPPIGSFGFFTRVRGSARNNIFVVGHVGTIGHFNGSTWHKYDQFFTLNQAFILQSVACNDRLVVAVGSIRSRAIAIIGSR
jgi:hypothetical protein